MVRKLGALLAGLMFLLAQESVAANGLDPYPDLSNELFNNVEFPVSDKFITDDNIVVTAEDGINIDGNIFIPTNLGSLAPCVIFINSWGSNEYQYLKQAAELAEKGYIVFSYSTRGFGTSGGLINTAGRKDMSDLSKVIDYLLANYQVDPNAIGAAGVSYGAGISLLGAGYDPRLKAVGALSGWGSLEASLYGNNSPRLIWGEMLTSSAQSNGRPSPEILEYWGYIKNQVLSKRDEVVAWAAERSPITYVDQINANNTAVYISNNYGDYLFQANSIMDLYSQLNTPKFLYLQSGTHASAEMVPAITGIGSNYIFEDLFRWFDIHLKGEENALTYAQPLQMRIKIQGYFDSFTNYPIPQTTDKKYYLHPRGLILPGRLKSSPYSSWWDTENTIQGGEDTLLSTKVPFLSAILEQLFIPTQSAVPLASRFKSAYYQTGKLNSTMRIRGIPNIKVNVKPHSNAMQIVAYLYDMNALGIGNLITHGVFTVPEANSGEHVSLNIDLIPTAYDVPSGNRLVIAFDTRDPQYKTPIDDLYLLDFGFSDNSQSILSVPRL